MRTRRSCTCELLRLVEAMRYALRWLEHRTFSQYDDIMIARQLVDACAAFQWPLVAIRREVRLLELASAVLAFERRAYKQAGRAALADELRDVLLCFDDIEPCHDDDRREWRARVELAAVPVGARI